MDAGDALAIEAAAISLLSRHEHTVKLLSAKLLKKGFDSEQVDQVLSDLQQRNLLSDQRFAEQYLEQRMRKGFGPLRIVREMREKGVPATLLDLVAEVDEDTWLQLMQQALSKKFGAGRQADYKTLMRCARFLEHRGFPASLISREISDVHG